MEVFTIGFTQKSAEKFFGTLRSVGIERLIDVRLNNVSQLAGFTKRDDLAFFLRDLCKIEYLHQPLLAPTQEMLDRYKKHRSSWEVYEQDFLELMAQRQIENYVDPAMFEQRSVLLCSEPTPEHCHRRLVAEYLHQRWSDRGIALSVSHL
jgi:uncharacterized protein (DUF488 family)